LISRSNKNNFVERSIVSALYFLKESVFSDEYASRKGFMQSLDPRVKLATLAVFLFAVLVTKSILVVLSFYFLCLLLAFFSGINLGFFLKRTWIFIPIFSLFIAIPALFSFFTPGEALLSFKVLGIGLAITRQGLLGAALFVSRVITSVSFAVLVSITTKHFELLKVLRMVGVPQVFVMVLGMCYRYIYLFAEVVSNTYIAIKSRAGGRITHKAGRHIAAWNMASLWYRSYQLNAAVYNAMVSRGYSGEPVMLSIFRTRPGDWIWLSTAVLISAGFVFIGGRYGLV